MTGEAIRPRVRYEKRDRVGYVTLDRPEVLNALDLRTHAELCEVWDDFAADDDLWLAVLSGAGDRAFSVGQDLREQAELLRSGQWAPTSFGSRGRPGWPRLTERFDVTKPVLARVHGFAYGGGFELALACDVIVASEDARFALPEARLGMIAGAGGLFRLTRQIPYRTAMGYVLTGRDLSAGRAYELGLVNEVVPVERLDECVAGWVADILRCAPLAVRAAKQTAARAATLPLEDAFAAEYAEERHRMHSQDAREGPLAFVEKRPPRWTAR